MEQETIKRNQKSVGIHRPADVGRLLEGCKETKTVEALKKRYDGNEKKEKDKEVGSRRKSLLDCTNVIVIHF